MISHDQQQKLIGALLKKPQNAFCADCGGKSPCWASLDFGVFVCMNCSGAHRALGQSVTRIKSTKLDQWNRDWLNCMQIGNTEVNKHFQNKLSAISNKKPNINSSLNEIKKFVQDKYVKKLYAKADQDEPLVQWKKGTYKKNVQQNDKSTKSEKKQNINAAGVAEPNKNQKSVAPQVKKNTKHVDLLDDISQEDNASNSVKNEKKKEELNLFQQAPQNKPLYNKDHFNSFSGTGAKHSTTGHITFDNIFTDTKKSQVPTQPTNLNNKNAYSTSQNQYQNHNNFGTGFYGNTGGYGGYPQQNQPHVTMNINMNMYPKVMNINMHGVSTGMESGHYYNAHGNPGHPTMTGAQNHNYSGINNINLNQQPVKSNLISNPQHTNLTLDLNDFTDEKKQEAKQTKSSWVDDWK